MLVISKNNGNLYKPSFNYSSIVMVVLLLAMYSVCSYYKAKNAVLSKIIEAIGKNTFGMYLTHFILISFINRIPLEKSLSLRLIEMMIVYICSLIISIIMRKIPFVSKLVTL